MKLYYSPGACSLSVHIALREASLAFELVRVNTKTHKLEDDTDFYSINPKGYVPLLEFDNGERLSEAAAILQYIADQAPAKNLAPANGTMGRYRLQEWLNFTSSEIHKAYGVLFNPASSEEARTAARPRIISRLRLVEPQLADKPFLLGEHFSVADAYLFTVLNWSKWVGVDLSGLPNLVAFSERVAARPAVQEAMKAEGLVK